MGSTWPDTLLNGRWKLLNVPRGAVRMASAVGRTDVPVNQGDMSVGTTTGGDLCEMPSRNSRSPLQRSFPVRQGSSSVIHGQRGIRVSDYSGTGHQNPSKNSSMIMQQGLWNLTNRKMRLHCLKWPG